MLTYPGPMPVDLTAGDRELHWDEEEGLTGDPGLLRLVQDEVDAGRMVVLTPTGPQVPLNAEDPRSILVMLREEFEAATWEGDMPPWPHDDAPADAIF